MKTTLILALSVIVLLRIVVADDASKAPILRIEAGMHTAAINDISVNAKGSLVLTSSNDQTARLWELPSGRPLRVFRPPLGNVGGGGLSACSISPDGSLAGVVGWIGGQASNNVYIFDTATGRMTRRLEEKSPNSTRGLAFSAEGRYLAVVGRGMGLRIWKTEDWRELAHDDSYGTQAWDCVDWYGEDRLVISSAEGPVQLYNFHEGTLKATATFNNAGLGGTACPSEARFSPDGRRIAVAVACGHSSGKTPRVAVLDGSNLSTLSNYEHGSFDHVAWIGSGSGCELAASSRGGEVWANFTSDFKNFRQLKTGQPQQLNGLRRLPNGSLLFASVEPSWGILETDGKATLLGASPHIDQRGLILGNLQISADASIVTCMSDDPNKPFDDPTSLIRFEVRNRQLSPNRDFSGLHKGGDQSRGNLPLTPDYPSKNYKVGDVVVGNIDDDGCRSYATTAQGSPILVGSDWSLRLLNADGTERWRHHTQSPAFGVNLADDDKIAVAAYGDGTIRWHRTDTGREILALFIHADRKHWVMWATDYDIKHWGRIGLENEDVEGGLRIKSVVLQEAKDAGFKVGDEIVRFNDLPISNRAALLEALSFTEPGQRVRVGIKRSGKAIDIEFALARGQEKPGSAVKAFYYDASPGAEDLIGWHVNRGDGEAADFFPASRFREEFFRPDVIDRVLTTRDVSAALLQANEGSGRKAAGSTDVAAALATKQPPTVELAVGGAAKKVEVDNATGVTLRYRVKQGASGEKITRVRVMIDGRPTLLDTRIPKDDDEIAATDVPLRSSDASISVIAENRFASSEPAVLQVIRRGNPKPQRQEPGVNTKPKLVLLAVGVSKFANPDAIKNLPFPAKDAADFVEIMRKQQGRLYSSIETRLLTDKDATAGHIVEGFDWLGQHVGPNDVAMILIETHGGNDSNMRYHFCAHDYDPKQVVRTTVSSEEIQRIINTVPCKVIFFIDTCHAGNALGKLATPSGVVADVNRVVNELSTDENGAVVFSASTGRQVSWESGKLGRGLFTQALIEGIGGKADLLGKGKITVASLETYIAARVPDLFNETIAGSPLAKEVGATAQTPAVAKPQTIPDFAIAVRQLK